MDRTGRIQIDQDFKCPVCFRSYKWKKALIRHQRYECGVTPRFTCSLCGNSFTHKHTLKNHYKAHLKQGHMSDLEVFGHVFDVFVYGILTM
ncbi:hypothetical protein L9F63_014943, partial [Diploptera punctata]